MMNTKPKTVTGACTAKRVKAYRVTFTADDVSELYHIISNRGFCSTRAKLVNALRSLDPDLVKRIDAQDNAAIAA